MMEEKKSGFKKTGGFGSKPGFKKSGGFGARKSFGGPRVMHKATCTQCGKECEVPFKPTEGKEVLCKECFSKKKRY